MTMTMMTTTMMMMTNQTVPAAHHQKIALTLIQTNLSHPLLEGAVPDTPPSNTPPGKWGSGPVAVSSQHAVIWLPIFTGQKNMMGDNSSFHHRVHVLCDLKSIGHIFFFFFFPRLKELCYMCGNRINFYCLYIGVLLKSALLCFVPFILTSK